MGGGWVDRRVQTTANRERVAGRGKDSKRETVWLQKKLRMPTIMMISATM